MNMPPWDRLPSFNQPVETTVALTSSVQLVAKGDPMRVLLIFSLSGSVVLNQTVIFPVPIAFSLLSVSVNLPGGVVSTKANVTTQGGFPVPAIGVPLVFDAKTHGPAVCQPWYAIGVGVGPPNLTVLSISMQSWPEDATSTSLIKDADNGRFRNPATGRANGTRPAKLYGNRWTQRQEVSPYSLAGFTESGLPFVVGTG